MSFTINNKLNFIDGFQFVSPSLESLIKILIEDNFKYLIQEFDNNVLNVIRLKNFILTNV